MAAKQESTVLVGKKPTTSYVIATVMSFNAGAKRVILKARGNAIVKAVSTAVMIRDRFLPNQVKISDIRLLSDKVRQGNKERIIAAIEIVLEREDSKPRPITYTHSYSYTHSTSAVEEGFKKRIQAPDAFIVDSIEKRADGIMDISTDESNESHPASGNAKSPPKSGSGHKSNRNNKKRR